MLDFLSWPQCVNNERYNINYELNTTAAGGFLMQGIEHKILISYKGKHDKKMQKINTS